MTDAIIGSTGFVGTNLLAIHAFSGQFNSRNIAEIDGREFDLVVCAAAPATMWAANNDPAGDLGNIRGLIAHLERVRARRFVLISTVAVLADVSAGLDETTASYETTKAYGRNRRVLEESCAELFPRLHILRLPALFGTGLKKNFLFDILNPVPSVLTRDKYVELRDRLTAPDGAILEVIYSFDENVGMYRCDRGRLLGPDRRNLTALNFTNTDSTFQYYGLARLWSDIAVALDNELPVLHLAPEPLRAGDIYQKLTGKTFEARTAGLYHENVHTRYASLWSGTGTYVRDKAIVLQDLCTFYEENFSQ